MIRFFAQGEPRGQPRARAFARNGMVRMYDPATAEGWKSCIAAAAREYLPSTPLRGPLHVDITFYFPRPKSHYFSGGRANVLRPNAPTYHAKKPDRDNCDKAVLDAQTTLGMWQDDAQVVSGTIVKKFADNQPGAWIFIEEMELEAQGSGDGKFNNG